jgi:hypothetical protein
VTSVREQAADARGGVGHVPARSAHGAQPRKVRFWTVGRRRRGAEPVDWHHQPRHCERVGVRVREFEPERGAAVTVRFEPEDAIEATDTADRVRMKVKDAVHRFGGRSVGTDSNCDARRGQASQGRRAGGPRPLLPTRAGRMSTRSHVTRELFHPWMPEAERARERERPVRCRWAATHR